MGTHFSTSMKRKCKRSAMVDGGYLFPVGLYEHYDTSYDDDVDGEYEAEDEISWRAFLETESPNGSETPADTNNDDASSTTNTDYKLLYSSTSFDLEKVQELILLRHLAPFYHGYASADEVAAHLRRSAIARSPQRTIIHDLYKMPIECPICFLLYPSAINYTKCCSQPLCTECFVNIKPSGHGILDLAANPSTFCPYCALEGLAVVYTPMQQAPSSKPILKTGTLHRFLSRHKQDQKPRQVKAQDIRKRKSPGSTPVPSMDRNTWRHFETEINEWLLNEAIRLSMESPTEVPLY